MTRLPVPNKRGLMALLSLFVVSLAGCAGWQSGASPEYMDQRPAFDGARDRAQLDDVSNGLVSNGLVSDSAASPLAGAFYNDGIDGDVHARTEHYDAGAGNWGADAGAVSGSSVQAPKQDPQPARQRMLIYSGNVRVEVARAEEAAKAFLIKVEQWGGYLQKQSSTSLTVRVPAVHFDDAFRAVREAGRVLSESRQANDVTEEFVDVGIRVDNARRSRDRLLEVLKLAEKVEDILRVEKELSRLTQEIERLEGRLKFLRDQVSMSTLRADFQSVATAPPVKRKRRRSRFRWLNRVGATNVMGGF